MVIAESELITARQARACAKRLRDVMRSGAATQVARVIKETLTPEDVAVLETFMRLVREKARQHDAI